MWYDIRRDTGEGRARRGEAGRSAGSCRNAAKVVVKAWESGNECGEVQESGDDSGEVQESGNERGKAQESGRTSDKRRSVKSAKY